MHFPALTFSVIYLFYFFSLTDAVSQLKLIPGLQCSYNFDLEVHTHRGKRSTKELNFKINAQVRSTSLLKLHLLTLISYISSFLLSTFITMLQLSLLSFFCTICKNYMFRQHV